MSHRPFRLFRAMCSTLGQPCMKPVAIFRFSATEGPGHFGEWLERSGIRMASDRARSRRTGAGRSACLRRHRHDGRTDERERRSALERAAARSPSRRGLRRRAGDRPLSRRTVACEIAGCERRDATATPEIGWSEVERDRCRCRIRGSAVATASGRSNGTTTFRTASGRHARSDQRASIPSRRLRSASTSAFNATSR